MKLSYKIFLTLVFFSCLILGLTLGVLQFSIQANFFEFLSKVEFQKQSKLIERLSASYLKDGGWDRFRTDPEAWHRLLGRSNPRDFGPPPGFGPPLPRDRAGLLIPNDPGSRPPRLCLFDQDKTYVAGGCRQGSTFDFHPILLSGRAVGWLGLERGETIMGALEQSFLAKQAQGFYLIGSGILVLSLLISYLVSRQVVRPIRALASGAKEMGRFHFDTQVQVNSKDELGDLAQEFNRLARTLDQYETMRKNWISDISHELRTPVAVIRSKIEALQDGIRKLTPALLDSLHRDILDLGQLITNLHQISLMDSKTLVVNLGPVCPGTLLNQALESFQIRFEQGRIEVQKDWQESALPRIQGDPELLRRVLDNLFENTLKYTDPPGILKISCQREKDRLRLAVEDSAPGVPLASLDAIFERLYRVDPSRNRILGGSGLGLSMSREIIGLHQGTIKASPSALGGLRIDIDLPISKDKPLRTDP